MAAPGRKYQDLTRGGVERAIDGGGEQKGDHLEMSVPAGPGRSLGYLKLDDPQHGPCCIPLGQVQSRRADARRQTGRNVLVPILPRCYTTPGNDPAQCALPREDGYLYIYRNGYLWREIEVIRQGYGYRDVNLAHCVGEDVRPATTLPDTRVILPHKVDGQQVTIEMCYSEVQWSWARINALGGMDPEDIRLDPDNMPPMPGEQSVSETDAAENRRVRMRRIDLSGYESGFPVREADESYARVENVAHANQQLIHLRMHASSRIPVVYLDDPLGVARRQVADYYLKEAELRGLVEEMGEHPHYASAVITYATFFDPQVAEREIEDPGYMNIGPQTEKTSIGRAAMHLDRALLEDILKVRERRALRVALRELKADYVSYLDSCAESFKAACVDYATRVGPDYIDLWELTTSLLKPLSYDPVALDAGHDLPQDHDLPKDDPGADYLARLLEPAHDMYALLFPGREQVDETSPQSTDFRDPEPPPLDGSFRPAAFALGIAASPRMAVALGEGGRQVVQLGEAVVADFISDFIRWRNLIDNAETHRISTLVRLAKAANMPDLKGLHLVDPGGPLDGKVIIDGYMELEQRLGRAESRQVFRRASVRANPSTVQIVDLERNVVVGSQNIRDIAHNRGGWPAGIDPDDWSRLWRKVDTGGTVRASATVTVIDRDAAAAQRFYRPDNAAVDAQMGRGLRGAGMALPPLVAVLQAVNMSSLLYALAHAKDWNDAIKPFVGSVIALLATAHTSLDAVVKVKVLANHRPTGLLERIVRHHVALRPDLHLHSFAATGAGISAAFSLLAIWEAVDLKRKGEGRAALAMGLAATTGLGYSGILMAGAVKQAGRVSAGAAASTLLRIGALAGGPVGWALLGVSVVAVVTSAILTYTPLERWAKYGPFARKPEDRNRHEYEKLSAQEIDQAVVSLLMSPSLQIQRDNAHGLQGPGGFVRDIVVEAYAPGFEVGRSILDVRLTAAANSPFSYMGEENQQPVRPYLCSHIKDPRNGVVVGLRYHYDGTAGDIPIRYRARARHITADGLTLPTVPDKQSAKDDEVRIDARVPGWTYVGPVDYR